MRGAAIRLARSGIARRAVELASAKKLPRPNTFFVLTYHRIAEISVDDPFYPGLISATPDDFRAQMRWLAGRYPIVSLGDVLEAKAAGAPLPLGSVVVTFDDAYRDFADNAWPIVRQLGIPSTLFVPTAFPGQSLSFWWDRLWRAFRFGTSDVRQVRIGGDVIPIRRRDDREFRSIVRALKVLPHQEVEVSCDTLAEQLGAEATDVGNSVMDWPDIRTVSQLGVTVAAHSRSHPRLDRLSEVDLSGEISGSVEDLRRHVPLVAPAFAYPDGGYSPSVISVVQRSDIELAFGTRRGANTVNQYTQWHELRRINVGRTSDSTILAAQFLYWSSVPAATGVRARRMT